jgi:glycosyltransferase involved in cell wall biosynthesis
MEERVNEKSRLLLMGNASQVHLQRWAEYFQNNGYEVLALSLEKTDRFPTPLKKPRIPSSLPGFIRYPLAVPWVRSIISTFKPHIINAHFLPNYGLIAAAINRTPWIFTSWGSDIMVLPERSFFHMKRTLYVLARASFITSDAEVMTKKLVDLGVSPGRILTVPFGVDRRVFTFEEDGVPRDVPRIVSCRKLEKVYSVETVIDAFPSIKAVLPQAKLTIAGDGSLKDALMDRAGATGHGDDILFVGEVDHDKIPALLRDHNLYVSTALSDTTSVSLLEAMACGLYPIVTNIPANREWIVDGTNGTRIEPGKSDRLAAAVIAAWQNAALRGEALICNRDIIEERANWYDNMKLVRGLFEQILEEERSSN